MAGIYIHIPFCKQACTYCNFHFSVSQKNKAAFVHALIKEILADNDFIADKNIETIYFGGGTPSLLSYDDLKRIFEALQLKFSISKNAEITLEANPDDITKEKLADWLQLGINRLSVGIQSFNEAELRWMNRAHNAAQSLHCIDEIIEAGFTNFSVDLIYGSPILTNENLIKNFEIIADKNVPHISCYALTVEKNTLLNKQIKDGLSKNIDGEKQAKQFYLLLQLMKKAGYDQYEISNFSKPNYRSKHNSSYWQGKPYWGFGASAHSYNGKNIRRWNIANNSLYINAIEKNAVCYEEETLSEMQQLNEYVMTSIRTEEGINLKIIKEEFGIENAERILKDALKFSNQNKVLIEENFISLTDLGKFFADGVAAEMFG